MPTVKKMLAAAAAVAGTLVLSAPAQAGTAAEPCGFYYDVSQAYYNHCGDSTILIRVDGAAGGVADDYCRYVSKGVTWLGLMSHVDNAYYISSGVCPV